MKLHERVVKYYEALYDLEADQLDESAQPILDYLDNNIVTLKNSLKNNNFLRALHMLWNLLCEEIASEASKFAVNSTEEQSAFFRRVLQMFPFWETYFEGGCAGLTKEEIYSKDYKNTVAYISYFTKSTKWLISEYYGQHGERQVKYYHKR